MILLVMLMTSEWCTYNEAKRVRFESQKCKVKKSQIAISTTTNERQIPNFRKHDKNTT